MAPPGTGIPIVSAWDTARWGGRWAIRAVASVAPYMTWKSQPRSRPSCAYLATRSGASLPPACVT